MADEPIADDRLVRIIENPDSVDVFTVRDLAREAQRLRAENAALNKSLHFEVAYSYSRLQEADFWKARCETYTLLLRLPMPELPKDIDAHFRESTVLAAKVTEGMKDV